MLFAVQLNYVVDSTPGVSVWDLLDTGFYVAGIAGIVASVSGFMPSGWTRRPWSESEAAVDDQRTVVNDDHRVRPAACLHVPHLIDRRSSMGILIAILVVLAIVARCCCSSSVGGASDHATEAPLESGARPLGRLRHSTSFYDRQMTQPRDLGVTSEAEGGVDAGRAPRSARMRAPTTARSLGAIWGIASSSISLKSWRSSTSSCIGDVAVTVATRSPPSMSAISPKNPPGPMRADLGAVDRGRHHVAGDDHEELGAFVTLRGEVAADVGLPRLRAPRRSARARRRRTC